MLPLNDEEDPHREARGEVLPRSAPIPEDRGRDDYFQTVERGLEQGKGRDCLP